MPTFRPPLGGVSYSEALAAAYAVATEEVVLLDTLEFLHPLFVDSEDLNISVRVVNSLHPLTATLEATAPMNPGETVTFQPVNFSLTRPKETASGQVSELELRVDNVSRILVPYLDMIRESREGVVAIWRPYASTDLTAPHISPVLSLTLRSISADMTSMVARAGVTDLTNRRFPAAEYTVLKYPWLTVR